MGRLFMGMPAGVHPLLRERVRLLEDACRESCELKRRPGTSADLADLLVEGTREMNTLIVGKAVTGESAFV
ncbi:MULTISPECIES: hypothetical protein [unclassified Streptomyces]|uniref:hypothetical protein n=1 Tax=unclassified Streptomyces TaxID=2593676 RepID=UPI00324BABB5